MGEFVDFDPSRFPRSFECGDCGDVLYVSHAEAEQVAYAGATIEKAVNTVRRSKGWWRIWDVRCPACEPETPTL
jgi:ribosomal protein S27E